MILYDNNLLSIVLYLHVIKAASTQAVATRCWNVTHYFNYAVRIVSLDSYKTWNVYDV